MVEFPPFVSSLQRDSPNLSVSLHKWVTIVPVMPYGILCPDERLLRELGYLSDDLWIYWWSSIIVTYLNACEFFDIMVRLNASKSFDNCGQLIVHWLYFYSQFQNQFIITFTRNVLLEVYFLIQCTYPRISTTKEL